jgi:spore coat polysaccharide biosynthesis protein SpsF (cytidylyltransferase family)
MGSSRLPNKVLMPILGKPLIHWMLDRVALSKEVDEIIVATTVEEHDGEIENLIQSTGFQVYRGSEEDVLDRYYQAANSLSVVPDAVVRLTGDCPLLDPVILDSLIMDYKNSDVDFLSNSEPLPSSWPDGMDVSIMSFSALRKAWSDAIKPSEREHVTFYFWNNPEMFRCKRVEHIPSLSKYRLTVDYLDDYDLVKIIIEHFGEEGLERVKRVAMDEIIKYLDKNPNIFKLNERYTRGMGWVQAFERDQVSSDDSQSKSA